MYMDLVLHKGCHEISNSSNALDMIRYQPLMGNAVLESSSTNCRAFLCIIPRDNSLTITCYANKRDRRCKRTRGAPARGNAALLLSDMSSAFGVSTMLRAHLMLFFLSIIFNPCGCSGKKDELKLLMQYLLFLSFTTLWHISQSSFQSLFQNFDGHWRLFPKEIFCHKTLR